MNTIKMYARFLEVFCLSIGIPLVVLSFFYKWFYGALPLYRDISDCTKKVTIYTGLNVLYPTATISPTDSIIIRVLAACIDGISVSLLLWGCICFIRVLRNYQQGELFSSTTITLFNKMSRIAFVWAIYEPLKFTFLSFITTIGMPSGMHSIVFGITSNDIVHIFIVGIFLIITSLMHEAHELKSEHDLTV
jgi:hypothetical protein